MSTMLDFYREHRVSPVTQDVTDRQAHFARRAHLYRSLGLPPMAIQGTSVLEVGPGSGENALYTLSLQPNVTYDLIEPNHVAAERLRALLPANLVNIVESKLEHIEPYPAWDLVLCEGLLGLCGSDPLALLEKLTGFVKPGGVLVITCIDAISDHSEVLRRALAQKYINSSMTLAEKVEALRPVFTPHLATLKGMTRSVDDWIIDNILNPASIGPTFSIPDALTYLDGRFEVLGCNPRFLMDWRWYKEAEAGNAWAIKSYWKNCHNLLDYRRTSPEREASENRDLMAQCAEKRACVKALEDGWPVAAQYFQPPEQINSAWFGRGQQYLSLVRVN